MLTKKPAYPVGIAVRGQGGARTKGNRHFRSERQRRRAFEKERDVLIKAAARKWGEPDAMPLEAELKLRRDIEHLQSKFGANKTDRFRGL